MMIHWTDESVRLDDIVTLLCIYDGCNVETNLAITCQAPNMSNVTELRTATGTRKVIASSRHQRDFLYRVLLQPSLTTIITG